MILNILFILLFSSSITGGRRSPIKTNLPSIWGRSISFLPAVSLTLALSNPIFEVHAISAQEIAQQFAASQGTTIVSERKLGLLKGTLQGCSANENCFSTSAKAAGKSIAPWSYAGAYILIIISEIF